MRSTKSSPSRSSDGPIACRRYLRFSVSVVLTPWMDASEELGGDDEVLAGPPKAPEGRPHDPLRLALGVHLGVVEEVDAAIERRGHAVGGEPLVQLLAERHPRSESQRADLETTRAEASILHSGDHTEAPEDLESARGASDRATRRRSVRCGVAASGGGLHYRGAPAPWKSRRRTSA